MAEVTSHSPGAFCRVELGTSNQKACYQIDPKMMPGVPPHWMLYVATADADASARKTGQLGGTVTKPAFEVGSYGRTPVLEDPQGAVFAIYRKLGKG